MTTDAKKELAAIVTVAEAVELFGLSKTRLHQLMAEGRVDFRHSGRTVLLTRASCQEYVRETRRA